MGFPHTPLQGVSVLPDSSEHGLGHPLPEAAAAGAAAPYFLLDPAGLAFSLPTAAAATDPQPQDPHPPIPTIRHRLSCQAQFFH